MSQTVFETERLLVRRWCEADLPMLLAVYGDANAMQWVGDGVALGEDDCARWLDVTHKNYERYGYGMFAVVLKLSSSVIGFCGIVHPSGQSEPEAKYAYLRSHWGRGFATEALVGLLRHGAGVHALNLIAASTAPENAASHQVLRKAGMERAELTTNPDGSQTLWFRWRALATEALHQSDPGAAR